MKMKRFLVVLAFVIPTTFLTAQDITTAAVFFQGVSDEYAKISDFSADLRITEGGSTSTGVIKFKNPNKVRIDFSVPSSQVFVFTGSELSIYIPSENTTLVQLIETEDGSVSRFTSSTGLSLMKRSYTIAYETGSTPVALDGRDEMVVALILHRRTSNETFRQIRLLVSAETKLILRVEAWTISGSKITYDFSNHKINTGIPDEAFLYSPPVSTVINNFLYSE